jgi:hypothetical protein
MKGLDQIRAFLLLDRNNCRHTMRYKTMFALLSEKYISSYELENLLGLSRMRTTQLILRGRTWKDIIAIAFGANQFTSKRNRYGVWIYQISSKGEIKWKTAIEFLEGGYTCCHLKWTEEDIESLIDVLIAWSKKTC